MALPCFMLVFCIPLLITGIWDRHLRVPFRVSSLPANELLPPLTYTITEDVVAVDGGRDRGEKERAEEEQAENEIGTE